MKTILIIEDNTPLLENLQQVLEIEGYRVLTTSQGLEGIELIYHHKPDLTVCDYILPDTNGGEILAKMRQHQPTANLPVLMITAVAEIDAIRASLDLPSQYVLHKPFDIYELISLVKTLLGE